MNKLVFLYLCVIVVQGQIKMDECSFFSSFTSCISSSDSKCIWNQIFSVCAKTYDYLLGCNPNLNRIACINQIGDGKENLAFCRFMTKCENIPDPQIELCGNHLNKSGCLSITNPKQVCFWLNNSCQLLEQEEKKFIQEKFTDIPFSQSACAYIDNYLIIHHLTLWKLLSYSPNLMIEDDLQFLQDYNIQGKEEQVYDDPTLILLENNFVMKDGKYAWYTKRKSKSIILKNLKITDRHREGCIAIEIENDADFEKIFDFQDKATGINQIYCQYLNRISNSYPFFIFYENKCQLIDYNVLNDQAIIQKYNLNCYSFNSQNCIYFDSLQQSCQILGNDYQYPCQPQNKQTSCTNSLCTAQQCKELSDYYIDSDSHLCVKNCYQITSQYDCEITQNCLYLGVIFVNNQIICSPLSVCDQIGVSFKTCMNLRAKCSWNESLQRCFTLSEEEMTLLKCSETINAMVCTLISLSDQLCYWQVASKKCINILDQPLLIYYQYFIYDSHVIPLEEQLVAYTISNKNLCDYNEIFYSTYDESKRQCNFDQVIVVKGLDNISKYACLNAAFGFCVWDGKCQCHLESYFKNKSCNDLFDVSEKCCQLAQVTSELYMCLFHKSNYSCKEQNISDQSQLECKGIGLPQNQCLQKDFCRYQAFLCEKLSQVYIQSIPCQSFHNINYLVCQQHNKDSQLCAYDEKQLSCYSPGLLEQINYHYSLNRYSCERVFNLPTFYDTILNQCVVIDVENKKLLNVLTCEGNFLSQQACESISTEGQICYWNEQSKTCNYYVKEFSYCSDYLDGGEKVCKALVRNLDNTLIQQNFCSFKNSQCLFRVDMIEGCGEDEQMNLHRCNSLTGYNADLIPTNMCAFINYTCISLNDNSLNTKILLKQISCMQANLATCNKVETLGQFCLQVFNNSKNYSIIDQKCISTNYSRLTCKQLNQEYDRNSINKNFCTQATDNCKYDEIQGCIKSDEIDNDCDVIGLSRWSCLNNTKNKRCFFADNTCQYLPEYKELSDCTLLNQFLCNKYRYGQCIWNSDKCESDSSLKNINIFSCSRDTTQTKIILQNNKCNSIKDTVQISCDVEGLNRFGCTNIKNQYCNFSQNQCQFYRKILCQDSQSDCKNNNTGNQKCVLKNGQCFQSILPVSEYDCDEFEETNYNFCYQYPNCIYNVKICQKQQSPVFYCQSKVIVDCVFHNLMDRCTFNLEKKKCQNTKIMTSCPQFQGYYSKLACIDIPNCNFGYTKTGKGFCYQGDFQDITCELIPKLFCLEDFSTLYTNLNCYYDGQQCKTLEAINQNCQFLSQYQSNYPACLLVGNNEECLYSHSDQICKFTQQYFETICQGNTAVQCSLIKQICYFNGMECTENGSIQEINKFGCLQQDGFWNFKNFQCIQLDNVTIMESCLLLSKNACLSQLTNQLFCRWINDQCEQILPEEGKFVDNCQHLNERACLNVRVSSVQCIWNKDINECQNISITSNDCTFNSAQKVSLSMCGNQIEQSCMRNENGQSCEILDFKLNDCSKYGFNEIGCINNTSGICQWKKVNEGGFCDSVNLNIVQCDQGLNRNACLKVLTRGQYCYWNEVNNKCENKILSDCESANNMNGILPCLAVPLQKCYYNQLINQCAELIKKPDGCQQYYNKVACLDKNQLCNWSKNQCVSCGACKCEKYTNKNFCLNSSLACQWLNDNCVEYNFSLEKIHCLDIPLNVSNQVCINKSLEPCFFDNLRDQCYPKFLSSNEYDVVTIESILQFDDQKFVSSLLTGQCDELLFVDDCIKARKTNQSCIWTENKCTVILDFNSIDCSDNVNIYGCLNISKKKQYCFWKEHCQALEESQNIETNVNVNVCTTFSINKIYKNYSCVSINLDTIKCDDVGISKITCLSITKQQCQWNEDTYCCGKFEYSNQEKCEDYKQISPYVCQMQETDSCIFDAETKNCQQSQKNSLIVGISKLSCLQNDQLPVLWEGEICSNFTKISKCDIPTKNNSSSCINRIEKPCIYDEIEFTCTSNFNIQSLKCSTLGLNLLGCVQVESEPCMFTDGKCQQFNKLSMLCNQVKNVNAKACALIQSEQCEFNQTEYSCQFPKVSIQSCNIKGSNQLYCQSKELCSWNNDYSSCKCKVNQQKEQCQLELDQCEENLQCIIENNKCRLKQCEDLTQENCINEIRGGAVCYLTTNNVCQPAVECEDILNPKNLCETIFINSSNCIQGNNQCYSYNNYEQICPVSDCLKSQCFNDQGVCRKKTCSDYKAHECSNQDGCYQKLNGNCDELISCYQISEVDFGQDVAKFCNSASKDGRKCNWQSLSIADEFTNSCTNQYCSLYAASSEICQGSEINSVSCVLINNITCSSCEEIKEECYCNQYQNICQYSKGKCNSILCSSIVDQKQCQEASPRCTWNSKVNNGSCLLSCRKIFNISDCNERLNECYYDVVTSTCLNGEKTVVDLSIEIRIEQFFGSLKSIVLMLLILIQ